MAKRKGWKKEKGGEEKREISILLATTILHQGCE